MNKYDIDLNLENRNSLSILLKRTNKSSTILEFGPANGRLTKYLKEELDCTIYAVEIDNNAASNLTQYCKELVIGDIESYEWKKKFQDVKFDTIIFADVLEHLYDPDKVLHVSKEFLKEDGSILVSLPNIAHNAIVMELLEDKFTYSKTGLLDDTHIRFFTRSSFLNLVDKCSLYCHYESGIYARAGETEFHHNYEDFEIGNFLQKREFGEIYQFLYELKKTPTKEKISDFDEQYKSEKLFGIAKLYIDTGDGFNEENSIEIKNPQLKKSLEFDVSKFGVIKNLRFDPFDKAVALKIDKSFLVGKDKTKQVIEFSSTSMYCKAQDLEYILTDDSQYFYAVEANINYSIDKIIIEICYMHIGHKVYEEAGKILSANSKELSAKFTELSNIKESKGYKFILFVRKLKGFFHA